RQATLDAARPHLLRIVGPNCLGVLVPGSGLNASFAHLAPQPGGVAFVTQSGALVTSVLDWAVPRDRKSTRLNSSHVKISYAVVGHPALGLAPYTTLFRSFGRRRSMPHGRTCCGSSALIVSACWFRAAASTPVSPTWRRNRAASPS